MLKSDYFRTYPPGFSYLSKSFVTLSSLETSGTIKYMKKGKSIWETHPIEKSRLIYQIGSADPDLALQAAKIVEDDV